MKYEKLGTTDISVSKICYCRMIAQAVHLNEHQQIQQSNMTYDAKNKEPGNRYDWSRRHLNFEIKRGREMGRVNGKPIYDRPTIIPLGTQEKSLKEIR